MRLPDDELDLGTYERQIGDPAAVHVGLRSRIEQDGYPAGYDIVLGREAVRRLSDVGRVYGLTAVAGLQDGAAAYAQPTEISKLDAALLAHQLRWLPKVSSDPVVLDAAERLAAIAEAAKTQRAGPRDS